MVAAGMILRGQNITAGVLIEHQGGNGRMKRGDFSGFDDVTQRGAMGWAAAPGLQPLEVGFLAPDGSLLGKSADFLSELNQISRSQLADSFRSNGADTNYDVIHHENGGLSVVVMAAAAQAQAWHLVTIPEAVLRTPGAVAIARLAPAATRARLQEFGTAFGMSPSVIRTVTALYELCNVSAAAQAAGVSFHTAKENLAKARTVIWAPNLPRLITWAGIGSLKTDALGQSDQIVARLFSLTQRQRGLAGHIADGESRADAARLLGISDAVAKKELAAIFDATGVANAIGLARLFADLRILAILSNTGGQTQSDARPYCRDVMVEGNGGRKIALSDYGPADGQPVFVLHNTMNCRGVDRALVAALQSSGYRPVSPDRPGYGDTDPVPKDCLGQDYLAVCSADIAAICQKMGLPKVSFIVHGPVHIPLALARDYPDLIDTVIIDAPERYAAGDAAQGMIASLKRAFAKRPWAVEAVVRMLCTLINHDRVRSNMHKWVADSPADRSAMDDPALMMDFYRKLIPFQRGRVDGFVKEQVLQATLEEPAPIVGTSNFSLLIGETDFMHDAQGSLAYWRRVLPDARVRILAGAGRFISYSHPHALIAELSRQEKRASPVLGEA